ncbi:hypothetical protein ONS95_000818 [Cadophora gregata]|uniref:uncharacterized protein n=1 Tax=Cadophora gregata TaxID=51156 RepID=UPI0026DB1F56|nr:uncharacterized protein ONS95_000818 [Cadophora gregata]KAK0102998.1 hypothetical protein ONS96_005611 [Cadophora gregata f. sp. sojae]KAK0128870.1 hypothetical protein ONS95_000818 [Cadophora gregata]
MKTQQFLVGAALLSSLGDCLPQILIPNRSTAKVSIITGGATLGDPFTLPPGFSLPPGVTLPPGFTIGTEITRSGTLPGFTFGTPPGTVNPPHPTSTKRPTSSSIKTTSSTSTSTTSPPPPTTKSTTSTTSTTSSSTSPPPTPTTSKTTSTSKSTTPPITQPPTTSKTSSTTKTTSPPVTTTAKLPASTNPYSAACPIPSTYTINNFISYDGPGGDVAFTISYGDGVFTCPNKFEHSTSSNGRFTLDCDDDGLVRVVTDGFSYVYVTEKFWCGEVPGPAGSYATLQSSANYTFPADTLFCDTDDINIRTCLQLDPDIVIPAQTYSAGGTISFTPLDTEGNPLPQCPTVVSTQPVVTDPATCGDPEPTTTGRGTTSVRFTQTSTVTINV